MRRIARLVGLGLGVVVGLLIIAAAALYAWGAVRLNRVYAITPEHVSLPSDNAALARGQAWATAACAGCHGEDLAGTIVFEDPALGRIQAPNLTRGQGGVAAEYTDADWVRAIRHGVGREGRALLVMPADAYYHLGDADLGALIAYLKSLPPVDRVGGGYRLTPLGTLLISVGAFGQILDAEVIAHTGPRPTVPPPGVTAAYGEYLVNALECRTCHGPALIGGKDPNPDAPLAPDLSPAGELGGWTETDLIAALRTGRTPGGRQLSDFMPWKYVGRLTDDELRAIWLYLQSLPPAEAAR